MISNSSVAADFDKAAQLASDMVSDAPLTPKLQALGFGFELVDSTRGMAKQFWPRVSPVIPTRFVRIAFVAKATDARPDEYAVRTFDEFKTVFLFVLGHPELYSETTHGDALEDYVPFDGSEI